MKSPDGNLKPSELILDTESKVLKDLKDMLYKSPMAETFNFIKKSDYPCLWNIYARKALEELDFINAEKAFL
jgi:hypothetical protein